MNTKEIVAFAWAVAFTDFDKYVHAIAKVHTVMNLGGDVADHIFPGMEKDPERLVRHAYQYQLECMADGYEADSGMAEDPEKLAREELRSWVPTAQKDAKAVRAAGLPWTLANAELAFHGKLPGQVKKRKSA